MQRAITTRSIPTRRCSRSAPPTSPRGCSAGSPPTPACPRRPPPSRRARSRSSSSLVTAALILATAVLLAPLFQDLPNAVLGAIVIAAVLGLIDVDEMRRYWAWRRTDFMIAVAAMVGVLLTTVLDRHGAGRPAVGRVRPVQREPPVRGGAGPHARPSRDVRRPQRVTRRQSLIPGLVIVRLDAPLYFFNANVAKAQILELVDDQRPEPRGVLIDLGAIGRPRRDDRGHARGPGGGAARPLGRGPAGPGEGLGPRPPAQDGPDGGGRRGSRLPVDRLGGDRLPAAVAERGRGAARGCRVDGPGSSGTTGGHSLP